MRSRIPKAILLGAGLLGLAASWACSPTDTEASAADIVVLPAGKAVDLGEHSVAGKVTIFDFHADWCAPCRIIGPKLEEFVGKHADRFALRTIDVIGWESEAAVHQGIEYLPYLAVVDPQGNVVAKGDESFQYLDDTYGLDLKAALLIF